MKFLKINFFVIFLTLFFVNLAFTQEGSQSLVAALSGKAVVPGPGDSDGSGNIKVTINQNQLCYELTVTNIANPTAAAIYEGDSGKIGAITVTLKPPVDGFSNDCINIGTGFTKRLSQNPENFYVNVHTAEFMEGAIRGQLSK
ncbi:MAG: CHRD domain-containing protein [Pyrinomonadaceae bacterium]|nr:CHRD domain-containing protein [Pyrinomonadaceae bacterium]